MDGGFEFVQYERTQLPATDKEQRVSTATTEKLSQDSKVTGEGQKIVTLSFYHCSRDDSRDDEIFSFFPHSDAL